MTKPRAKPVALVVRPGPLDANMMIMNNVRAIRSAGFDVVTVTWNVTRAAARSRRARERRHVFHYDIYAGLTMRLVGYLLWQVFVALAILRERPDVVHCMDSTSHMPVLALRALLRYRVVMDFRDVLGLMLAPFPFPLPQVVTLYERLCTRLSDTVMGCQGDNNAMYRYLGKWALRGREIVNVLCVPDFTFPVCPAPLARGEFVINISGHISARRGAFLALDVFRGQGSVMLEFVGDIPAQKGIRQAIEACPNARYLGKLPHADAIERMRRASLIWLHYDNALQSVAIASSCKMFEAMAVGRPYVAASGCWMAAVAEKHGLGYAVEYGDRKALARLVEGLIAHPERIREAGLRGRETYLRQYRWEQAREPLLREYARMCSEWQSRKAGRPVWDRRVGGT